MSGESCAPRGSLLLLATLEAPVLAANSRGRLRAGGPQYRGAAVLSLHPCTPPRYATRACRTQGPKTTCLLWAPASKGRPPGRVECRPLLASTATLLATPSRAACAVRAPQCSVLAVRARQCRSRHTIVFHAPSTALISPFHHEAAAPQCSEKMQTRVLVAAVVKSLARRRSSFLARTDRAGTGCGIDSAPHGRPAMPRERVIAMLSVALRPTKPRRRPMYHAAIQGITGNS